jgi:hypothetical protein
VLIGDLRGRVVLWQAKYFVRGFGTSQKGQARDSFASALRAAGEHGYAVDRWVLCIPSSIDGPATRWWQGWKDARQRETGVTIELWDETKLRELLLKPDAKDVLRHYYNPYLDDGQTDESLPVFPLATAAPMPQPEPVWSAEPNYALAHRHTSCTTGRPNGQARTCLGYGAKRLVT